MKNTFLSRRFLWQKQGILDILAVMNDNTKINIELQVKTVPDWDKRQIFYLAKLYVSDLGVIKTKGITSKVLAKHFRGKTFRVVQTACCNPLQGRTH